MWPPEHERKLGNFFSGNQEEPVDVSIVVPLLNEEESVESLYSSVKGVMELIGKEYEILFVDDGSTDGTFEALAKISKRDNKVKVIRFRRNFGQTAAMSAGFDYASGSIIVTMDGDLQNDPRDIPRLLEKMERGYDIVSGWRVNRKDKLVSRKLPSKIANWLIGVVTGVKLHDYGCSLKAYRAEVIKNVHLYGEMHRFIPALASWFGANITEIPVNHYSRKYGRTKYGISRTLRVVLDLITVKFLLEFSTRPLQMFGLVGMVSFTAGLLINLYLTFLKLAFGAPLASRPLLLLGILLMFLGVQFITIGLLAELQVRTYHEAQGKPIYVVKEIL